MTARREELKKTILAGAGFLADAYDLFVINIGTQIVQERNKGDFRQLCMIISPTIVRSSGHHERRKLPPKVGRYD
jgi:hypothetical protein